MIQASGRGVVWIAVAPAEPAPFPTITDANTAITITSVHVRRADVVGLMGRAPVMVPLLLAWMRLSVPLAWPRSVCDTARMTDERTIDPTEEQHREAFDALQTAIMGGDAVAVTPIEVRRGAAERSDVPERFAAYVDTIHDHAYQVSDRTVSDLRAAGASQDEVFEVTISAAFGAARARLEAGLAALREATRAS